MSYSYKLWLIVQYEIETVAKSNGMAPTRETIATSKYKMVNAKFNMAMLCTKCQMLSYVATAKH